MFFNYEKNNIYYGLNKIFRDGKFLILAKDKYLLVDFWVIDFDEKIIKNIDESFINILPIKEFKKIKIINNGIKKTIEIDDNIIYTSL